MQCYPNLIRDYNFVKSVIENSENNACHIDSLYDLVDIFEKRCRFFLKDPIEYIKSEDYRNDLSIKLIELDFRLTELEEKLNKIENESK